MPTMIEWFTLNYELDGEPESVGKFPLQTTAYGDWLCPKCGKEATYRVGQIDQDFMGNDIDGDWYDCYSCMIGTEPEEL